jgi:hypothetical protein
MKPKIVEIVEQLNLSLSRDEAEAFASAIIEEFVFAMLLNYEGKINPITLKEMLDDQLGLGDFYFDE